MNTPLVVLTIISTLVAAATTLVAWRMTRESARRSAARIAALAEEIHGPGMTSDFPAFSARASIVPLAAAVILGIASVASITWLAWPSRSVARPAAPSEPLQLIALKHAMTPEGLLVTGTIRNGVSAARRQDLSVLVLLYDQQGHIVTEARGDAGSGSLEPGESSTFALTAFSQEVPATFKVSFRQRDVVVPHVDRRTVDRALARDER